MAWIIDWLPWWFWWIAVGAAAFLTAPYWLPAALWVWGRLPPWAKGALIAAAAVLTAYVAGRNRGRRNAADEQARRDAEASKRRLETNEAIRRLTDPERSKERERWERD